MSATTTTAVAADTLIARVHEIGPILQKHSGEGESERRLPAASYDAMKSAGLFRMGKPAAYGGSELDPVSLMRVVEEVALYDSASAWNLQISCAVSLFFAWFPEEAAREVLGADPDATLAGTLFPPGQVVPSDGGYSLSGRWAFASGSQQATWCFGPCLVMDGDSPRTDDAGNPVQMLFSCRTDEAEILETWNTMGMRGTGSQDVVAKDLFVPARRVTPFASEIKTPSVFGHPTYRMVMWIGIALLAPPALGVARKAIETLMDLAKKKTPNYTTTILRERPVVQSNLAKAQAVLDSSRAYLYEALNEGCDCVSTGDPLSTAQKGKIQLATSYAVRSAADAVDLVCEAAGASAVRLSAPYERWFRDVHTMTQHAAASTARYQSVGQLMLGLESDWPFFEV